MSSASSFSSTQIFQDFLGKFHSRKLLTQNPPNNQTISPVPPYFDENSSLHKNFLLVLSVLVCSIIFTLVLNYFIRCTLRCLSLISSDSSRSSSARPPINKGIKKKTLNTFPVEKYSAESKLPGLETECVICLSEFASGDRVRLLPKCNHGFHVHCIDKWLKSNSSCPKCRHCLIETCEKIAGCSKQTSSSAGPSMPPVQVTIISITPLEPEGIVHNHGGHDEVH
ncbi:RING-H2 finger protein [Melia azedarach]|uniref:RING-H2 finger protein n=2 Tax=Melia azedarach TaxID=155640 RepID=A0ACC1XW91_MELAZ|nr:RING-H2 finger protein [Melia azedarach]KAJ4715401.1 RING-H2 finger protein [Melia azedarach]